MSKLAHAADVLSWLLTWALPALVLLHALALAGYAALVRSWDAIKPLLPRNLAIMGTLAVLALVMVPLHHRAERWHYAAAYQAAAGIEARLAAGDYAGALAARKRLVAPKAATSEVDRAIDAATPHAVSKAIALANGGDYAAAIALVEALPPEAVGQRKRDRLLELWRPYAERQRRLAVRQASQAARGFLAAAAGPLAAYDRLAKETQPRALQLDPTAMTHVDGQPVHPLAPVLLAASVRAKEIEGEVAGLPANQPTEAGVKSELAAAADAFKRACEESLAYANSADAAPAARAKLAFADARAHRDKVEKLMAELAPPPGAAGAPLAGPASPESSAPGATPPESSPGTLAPGEGVPPA